MTVDKVGEPAKKLPQYVAALSVCLGSVAAGTVLGWTSNMDPKKLEAGSLNDIPIDEDDGWIGSMATLGAMLMCFPIGTICDRIGRKLSMLLTVIPFTLGWVLICFSDNIEMIYAGRFFTGLAGGAFCVAAPLYTSEIAETSIRGALGSYFQLLLTVGILLAYITGYALDPLEHSIVLAVVPLVFFVVFFFQPETPVYLLLKNREADARKSLLKLRGGSPNYDLDAEITTIQATVDEQRGSNMFPVESFKKRSTRTATLVCFSLMFFQQMSGINAVIFYTRNIFDAADVSIESTTSTMVIGVIQVVATLVSSMTVEKLGRRLLLILSALMMAVSIIVLGIFFTLQKHLDKDTIATMGFIPILALCVFMVVFSLGFGPIPWMIASELLPAEVKSFVSSAAGTFNWLLAFIITSYYKDLQSEIGGDVVFYIFGGFSIAGVVFIYFVVPETKGKSLDEIQRELNREPRIDSSSSGVENAGFSQ